MISGVLLPAAQWWLATTLVMLAALPIARRVLGRLPDEGHSLARPLGLLLGTLMYWLAGLLGVLPRGPLGAWLALGALGVLGRLAAAESSFAWRAYWTAHRRRVLILEGLYAAGLVAFAVIRSYTPMVETSGGEKWMEMAFLSSVLESPGFPPLDPWLSGHSISYYHLGYLIAGWVTQVSLVGRAMAFNLVIPMTFGMCLAGAAGLGYNLVTLAEGPGGGRRAWAFGGLTAMVFGVMGNLMAILETLYLKGWPSAAFYKWLAIKNLGVTEVICGEDQNAVYASGALWPSRFIWWWRSSRVLSDADAEGRCREVIQEFPFFSFMLGDVHPHVMTLPYAMLAMGLGLAVLLGAFDSARERDLFSWPFLILPISLGALGFLNTWDLPTFMGLVGLAYLLRRVSTARPAPSFADERLRLGFLGLGLAAVLAAGYVIAPKVLGIGPEGAAPAPLSRLLIGLGLAAAAAAVVQGLWARREDDPSAARLLDVLRFGVWLAVLAIVIYVPFYAGFSSQAKGVGLVDIRSRLAQWLVHFGPHLWAAAGGIAVLAASSWRHGGVGARRAWRAILAAGGAALLVCLLLKAWVAALLAVFITLAFAAAAATSLGDGGEAEEGPSAGRRAAQTFALLCLGLGLSLAAGVEFVFLRDVFNNRMNSVFKFYYQAWLLLSVGAAFALAVLTRRPRHPLAVIWAGGGLALMLGGLMFPAAFTRERVNAANGFQAPPRGLTLNAFSDLQATQAGDWAAVEWLRANSQRGEIILEAPGGGYDYAGRISMASGRPALLGWRGHEHQWRGDAILGELDLRGTDIDRIYGPATDEETMDLLRKYGVRYVVVGREERGRPGFDPGTEDKFGRLMDLVMEAPPGDPDGTRLYRRR